MKKVVRLTESDIKRMVMESMDAWEDAIYKNNQDQGFRHRYGIGQDWPHYDSEDYDNGIWQDDDGKCWTVYPGEREATCLDDEMNESRGLGYGLSDDEKRKVRDEYNGIGTRKYNHKHNRGVKIKPGEDAKKKAYDIFKREGDRRNPFSITSKKNTDGWAEWVANMQDDDTNESVGRKTIRLTESELKCIIRESVKRCINENIDKGPTDRKMVDKRLSLMSDKQREALENLYNEFGKQFDFYDWVWNVTFSPNSKEFDNEDDAVNFAQVMYHKYPFLTKPKIWNNNGRFEVNYEEIRL